MIRITGGVARGRTLKVCSGGQVRPTTDKVRQAIFNLLEHRYSLDLSLSRALDLFSGSGSLGLEFLSRGGAEVHFVEADPRAGSILKENLRALSGLKLHGRGEISIQRVERVLKRPPSQPYDLVFVDPPYGERLGPLILEHLALGWVSAESLIIIEHDKRDPCQPPPLWSLEDRREYGDTELSFFRWRETGEDVPDDLS